MTGLSPGKKPLLCSQSAMLDARSAIGTLKRFPIPMQHDLRVPRAQSICVRRPVPARGAHLSDTGHQFAGGLRHGNQGRGGSGSLVLQGRACRDYREQAQRPQYAPGIGPVNNHVETGAPGVVSVGVHHANYARLDLMTVLQNE